MCVSSKLQAVPPPLWLGSERFGILNRFRFRIWFLAAPHARAGCAPGSHTPRSQHYREHQRVSAMAVAAAAAAVADGGVVASLGIGMRFK